MKINHKRVKILKLMPLENTDYVMISKKNPNDITLIQKDRFLIIDFTRLFGHECESMNLNDYYFTAWPGKKRIARKNIPMVYL